MTSRLDPVRLRTGSVTEIEMWSCALNEAGIEFKVVGDELAGSLGTALNSSIEIWVHAEDFRQADDAIVAFEASLDTFTEDAE